MFAVKGLSAHDYLPTGPFKTRKQAEDWLLRHSDGEHVKRYFGDSKKWCEFMIYEIKKSMEG